MRRVPIEICENFTGVNRLYDQQSIKSNELYQAQNMYAATRGIAEHRLGWTKHNTNALASALAGRELIRFYEAGTGWKIAAFNLAAGDKLVYAATTTGNPLTEITGSTSLSANKNWKFVQYQGALYAGNATETMQKMTAHDARADITVVAGKYTSKGYPAGPYRGRILSYGDATSASTKKRLYYTNTLTDDFETNNYVYIEHPENISAAAVFGRDEDAGAFGDLAIFTPTSTWIHRGDFGADASLDRASDRIGTLSPLSLVETPWGLVGLGYDGTDELVVFMIPVGAYRPLVISDYIRTSESLPVAYRKLANAVYYDGFYRLSFVPSGQTVPNREWWCDLRYFNTSQHNYGVGWWGPMTGRSIGAMAVQADASDSNELIGVTSTTSGTTGFIMNLDVANTYTDNTATITCVLETKSMDGKDPVTYKSIQGYSIGASCYSSDDMDVVLTLDEGPASTSQSVVFAPIKTGTANFFYITGSSYNPRINLTDGSAFFDVGIASVLTDYLGYYLVVTDPTGKTIEGWIKAAGSSESLGSELFTDSPFDVDAAWTKGTGWTVSGGKAIAASSGGRISETLSLTGGQLYKAVYVCDTYNTGWHSHYLGKSTDDAGRLAAQTATIYYNPTSTASVDCGIQGQLSLTATFTSASLKAVTAPGSTGVTIASTYGGTTYNWVTKTSGFNSSHTSGPYKFYIYPPYSENADYIHPSLFGHRASVKCTYDDGHLLKIKRVALIAGKTKRIAY